jgi:hypothetical protein
LLDLTGTMRIELAQYISIFWHSDIDIATRAEKANLDASDQTWFAAEDSMSFHGKRTFPLRRGLASRTGAGTHGP